MAIKQGGFVNFHINLTQGDPKVVFNFNQIKLETRSSGLEFTGFHFNHTPPINLLFLANIRYEESNLHLNVFSFLNTEIKIITTSRAIEGKLIGLIFILHDQNLLHFIDFNDTVDLIFVLITKRVKIWREVYLSHDD